MLATSSGQIPGRPMSFFKRTNHLSDSAAVTNQPTGNGSHPPRVLVVEDELLIAMLLEEYLESFGCEVVGIARDSASACRIVDQEHPDLALLDINLTGETSAPVARRMASEGRPFIFVTACDNLDQLPRDLRESRVLEKPVDPARLRTRVGQATAHRLS
jgi:DNA-binding response OmpR family regulator